MSLLKRNWQRQLFFLLPYFIISAMVCAVTSSIIGKPLKPCRGRLLSLEKPDHYSLAEISDLLADIDYDLAIQYPVDLYKIVYETIDTKGNCTRASGLAMFPIHNKENVPLLSYQHGTILKKESAPSQVGKDILALGIASMGYALCVPDYLGFGISDGMHPYVHASSLASASLDMIRAARELAKRKSVALKNALFLLGYSEGGYATMALHREIETNYPNEFNLVASAPMAGPYDLSGLMKETLLSGQPHPSPGYVPYVVLAYNDIYSFNQELSDVFKEPYATRLPRLYDGKLSIGEINPELPESPREMFHKSYVEAVLSDNDHPFVKKLQENDVYDWRPHAPMFLLHSKDDDQVTYLNTIKAYNRFLMNGATHIQIDTSREGSHGNASRVLFHRALKWFQRF